MPASKGPKFSISDEPRFNDPDAARQFLEDERWPDGIPTCPHCREKGKCYRIVGKEGSKTRKGLWKCGNCRKQFTVTVGSIFEDSHIPLHKWLHAIHLLCSSKKGMSAHQLHRNLGVTYKSAWFMGHRIRYAMTQEPLSSKLGGGNGGTVEVDETYVGGREKGIGGGGVNFTSKKVPVVAMVERSLVKGQGKVRSLAVDRVTLDNIKPMLKEHIEKGTTLNTDEAVVYYFCRDEFPNHDTITHKTGTYTRFENGRMITTNTVEGTFSLLKRGVYGVYHHWSRQHMHRYLSEFDFRYNARSISDEDRAEMAIQGAEGKRLKYRDSCGRRSENTNV